MRKRIHVQIALVGGQPTPVYQGIIHLHPDQVVLVCSKNSRKVADDIRRQLPFYENENILIYEISDIDLEDMYKTAEFIEQALPKGITLSLNLSGGMKLWSIIFNNVFRRKRRSCHSFFIGQNGTFFDLKEKVSGAKVDFDMNAQFEILGHEIDSYTLLSEYDNADLEVLDKVLNWAFSEDNHENLKKLTSEFYNTYKAKFHDTLFDQAHQVTKGSGDYLKWDPSTKTFDGLLSGKEIINLTSPHAEHILLNTGWFELYVANIIANFYPKDQISLNCVFKTKKDSIKNEVDIIVKTDNKLIFVECKTQIYNATDIDKFRSVVRNFGGLGSKPLFVTNSKMKPDAKEKCEDYDITRFHFGHKAVDGIIKPPLYSSDKIKSLAKVLDNLNNKWNYK